MNRSSTTAKELREGGCRTREREEEGITKKVVGAVRRRAQQSECGPGLSAACSTRRVGVQALERRAVRRRRNERTVRIDGIEGANGRPKPSER